MAENKTLENGPEFDVVRETVRSSLSWNGWTLTPGAESKIPTCLAESSKPDEE